MREWMVRLRKDRSQHAVACSAGVSQSYYSTLENGLRGRRMSPKLMQKLAKAYDLPVAQVVSMELAYQERGDGGTTRAFGDQLF